MHIAHTVGAQLATLTTTELLLEEQNYKNGIIWVYSIFKSFVFNIVLKCVGGWIGQQCEKLVLLGTTASLASTHPPHAFIHHLINPISLVITHTFNPFLTHCLLPFIVLIFTTILTHPYVWLTSHLLLHSHLLPVLPLLARVARQCSNAICQRSMPKALCPNTHSPTDTHKHTHSLARTPSSAGYTNIYASATRSP